MSLKKLLRAVFPKEVVRHDVRLEEVLQAAFPKGYMSGYLAGYLNDVSDRKPFYLTENHLTIKAYKAYNAPERGIRSINVSRNFRPSKTLTSPEEVRALAEEFGGNDSLNVNGFCINKGKYHYTDREAETAQRLYQSRDLYLPLFELLGVAYQEYENKLFIAKDQPRLHLNPDIITEAYSQLLHAGRIPSIGSGSPRKWFSICQKPHPLPLFRDESKEETKEYSRSWNLNIGTVFGAPCTSEEIEVLDKSLRRQGIRISMVLPGSYLPKGSRRLEKNWSFESGGPPI